MKVIKKKSESGAVREKHEVIVETTLDALIELEKALKTIEKVK